MQVSLLQRLVGHLVEACWSLCCSAAALQHLLRFLSQQQLCYRPL
jgi:hypothetical protein